MRVSSLPILRCGDAAGGWSAVYSFMTPPDNTNTPFTIAIYGDMVRYPLQ
jgi:hypothetical protein